MTTLVGYYEQYGTITTETGEVRPWSNRYLRCITDENMEKGEHGLKIAEQKLKTVQVCKSLGISENSSEDEVDKALDSILNSEISMIVGLVKGKFEVIRFNVVNKSSDLGFLKIFKK